MLITFSIFFLCTRALISRVLLQIHAYLAATETTCRPDVYASQRFLLELIHISLRKLTHFMTRYFKNNWDPELYFPPRNRHFLVFLFCMQPRCDHDTPPCSSLLRH